MVTRRLLSSELSLENVYQSSSRHTCKENVKAENFLFFQFGSWGLMGLEEADDV
jgi:hypothetical protein